MSATSIDILVLFKNTQLAIIESIHEKENKSEPKDLISTLLFYKTHLKETPALHESKKKKLIYATSVAGLSFGFVVGFAWVCVCA